MSNSLCTILASPLQPQKKSAYMDERFPDTTVKNFRNLRPQATDLLMDVHVQTCKFFDSRLGIRHPRLDRSHTLAASCAHIGSRLLEETALRLFR